MKQTNKIFFILIAIIVILFISGFLYIRIPKKYGHCGSVLPITCNICTCTGIPYAPAPIGSYKIESFLGSCDCHTEPYK